MKTVQIPKQARSINSLLNQARKQDLIVQAADGSEFMLTVVDEFELEIAATRRNKKLMAFLEKRAKSKEWIPLEDVESELGLTDEPKGKARGRK
jgi:hypothetical protein